MNRTVQAFRLHLITWRVLVGWPWGILLASFAVNLLIFAAIGDQGPDENVTGGLLTIYVVAFATFVSLITQVFPFALGLSLTRRSFYLGTGLLVLVEALVFGVAIYLCKIVEDATAGWGLSLRFFGLPFVAQEGALLQLLVFTVPFLLVGFAGMLGGTIYLRWGTNGLFTLAVASIVVVGGLVALLFWQRQWAAVGSWFADQSAVALFAGWPVLLAAVLAGAGFLTIRRATV